jgi:hypothetical protein
VENELTIVLLSWLGYMCQTTHSSCLV